MPTPATLAHLDEDWAANFDCGVADLHRPGVTFLRNGGDFATYAGAYLLRWGEACVFTAPDLLAGRVAERRHGLSPDEVFHRSFLAALFGEAVDRIIGPAFRSVADSTDFRRVDPRATRLLSPGDDAALHRLAEAVEDEAWEHSGIHFNRPPNFGCYVSGELVSAGMLLAAGERLRNVGIVTHPARRGQGYGRAVVSFMTAYALDGGGFGHCQTLLANAPSIAIARSLGYQQYATALAVRLKGVAA
jgi:RimJ/RimL family protein N-acetyltransferase